MTQKGTAPPESLVPAFEEDGPPEGNAKKNTDGRLSVLR